MMQARWGSHGDYEIIALCPNSPQECFDLMIDAFNLSEEYRTPVLMMMDESVGQMTEKVVIPAAADINIFPRRFTKLPPSQYLPFKPGEDGIPEMVKAGDGYRIHVTGLTHDEKGYPAMNWQTQKKLVGRLVHKIRDNADRLMRCEEYMLDDADHVLVAYGITSRVAKRTVQIARAQGIKLGLLRPLIVWPFPENRIRQLAERVQSFLVVEMNYGQLFYEVERCVVGRAKTDLLGHGGGMVHEPEEILQALREAA
jgi:2-oxoglutarate/2-oxoacid ferredoxin oxidoreductase subunit alpha